MVVECSSFILSPLSRRWVYFSFLPSLGGEMTPDAMSASRSDLSSLKATTT
jgi:hypothetical protein